LSGKERFAVQTDNMALKTVQFVALVLMALALVPSGAHFFGLPNKIGLAQDAYFTAQSIYRGWALFGIVSFGALFANAILAFMLRREGAPFWLAVTAAASVVVMLAVFFTWTYPGNVATENWTRIPADWQALRTRWEYSHALNAVVMFVGFCALVLAVLNRRA